MAILTPSNDDLYPGLSDHTLEPDGRKIHNVRFNVEDPNNPYVSTYISLYHDYYLVPAERPSVSPPEVRTNILEIPGSNGSIDLSTSLIGRPLYGRRTGSWEFICLQPPSRLLEWSIYGWNVLKNDLINKIHGKNVRATLSDEEYLFSDLSNENREYQYKGRVSVSDYSSNEDFSTITIDYDFEPFAVSAMSTKDVFPLVFRRMEAPSTMAAYYTDYDPYTGQITDTTRYFANNPYSGELVDIDSPSVIPMISVIGDPVKVKLLFSDGSYREQVFASGLHTAYRFEMTPCDHSFFVSSEGSSSVEIYWYNRRL